MIRLRGFEHVHVTEREAAHTGPCGADNGKFEDCFWVAMVEFLRATGHPEIPATHEEAEALRCDSGDDPEGPSDTAHVITGVQERYKLKLPPRIGGAQAIWDALTPGKAAWVAGTMAVFNDTERWRRWDPTFADGHAAAVFRLDDKDEVWWCDGLAPVHGKDPLTGTVGIWNGEPMPKKDFLRFANGAFVAAIKEGGGMPKIEARIERWRLKNSGALVTTLGLPLAADDSTADDSQRLAFFGGPPLTAATPRFVLIAKDRLEGPLDISQDDELRAALAAYSAGGAAAAPAADALAAARLEGRRAEWERQAAESRIQLAPKP